MPFPSSIREEACVRSRRHCCVCNHFGGREIQVHHIVQEADGGPNTIDNAIPLCATCHAEAGHYNPRHPLGTKYSPSELRRHRDEWWSYCAQRYAVEARPKGYREPAGSGRGVPLHERQVGVLWSLRADIAIQRETVRFEARLVASDRNETMSEVSFEELFARPDGTYLVYAETITGADYCTAILDGDPEGPLGGPLRLAEVQERWPSLAALAGIQRIRTL